MTRSTDNRQLTLYGGPVQTCVYLPARQSRSWFVDPAATLTPEIYGQLLALGYRRSGNIVYRPDCPGCRACVPVRVPVRDFHPHRWARRNRRWNQDLALTYHHQKLSNESFELYRRYQRTRHSEGEMDYDTALEVECFLYCDWLEPLTLEWRLGSRLVAVAIVDRVPEALSAVYCFFDPDMADRGLGTHAILGQIELAGRWDYRWLYLGYWIAQCPKMSYKRRFQPLEALYGEEWQTLE